MTFNYLGLTIEPIGNLKGNFCKKTKCLTSEYELKPQGYDYKGFYKVAKKHKASCDVFKINGRYYIPCDNGFMGLYNFEKSLKKCSEYDRYYKWAREGK